MILHHASFNYLRCQNDFISNYILLNAISVIMYSSSNNCLIAARRSKSIARSDFLALTHWHAWDWSKISQIFVDKHSLFNHLLYFIHISFFQALDFLCWLSEDAAMIEHTIELQFTMNDMKNKNRDKEQHVHSDENEHKKEQKQQNDYEKWDKFKMLSFTLS